mgnify:CR=1 FL=1
MASVFLVVFVAFANAFEFKTHGVVKQETVARISPPRNFTALKEELQLIGSGSFSKDLNSKISGRFSYDPVYRYTDTFPPQVRSDQQSVVELRDTYLDYSRGPFDIRLGKQQVVWGEAVGVFFADVVNAKDLREFILPDFDMIRIPQWGADFEYTKNEFHAEFVWLPGIAMNKYGVTGSEFAFPFPVPEGATYSYVDPQKPKTSFNNSETGLRLSYLLRGWDMSAFYYYTWDKAPAMYRSISPSGVYQFDPRYNRLHIAGSTFSKELGDFVLKGEFVYNRKGSFSNMDPGNPDGISRKDYIDYLLGLDYTFWGKIDTNVQFMQRIIFKYDKALLNEESVRNSFSFWVSRKFLEDRLEAEFLVITSLMEPDVMYRPKLTYTFKNNWKCRVGLDLFQGVSTGTFGKFEKKKRVYAQASYTF